MDAELRELHDRALLERIYHVLVEVRMVSMATQADLDRLTAAIGAAVANIRAAIDATEADARAADVKQGDPDWFVSEVMGTGGEHFTVRSERDSRPIARVQRLDGDGDEPAAILDGAAVAHHIARHDPASVLRRCAADRRMVELHAPPAPGYGCPTCWEGVEDGGPMDAPCPTLLALAEGYGVEEET